MKLSAKVAIPHSPLPNNCGDSLTTTEHPVDPRNCSRKWLATENPPPLPLEMLACLLTSLDLTKDGQVYLKTS